MKTKFSIICMIAAAMTLASCTKYTGPEVIDNVIIHVEQKHWQYSDQPNNNYFVAEVNMPELTRRACNEGLIKMYRIFNYGKNDAKQVEMPYSNHVEEYVSDDWVFYNEKVDYEFQPGKIYIYYQVSNFEYEIDESYIPAAMDFRCVIMY